MVDESHIFYKKVPPGFLGSKKPKSAEKVRMYIYHALILIGVVVAEFYIVMS